MLQITSLLSQGWFFKSKQSSFVVDPLLFNEFGHGPRNLRFQVWPPQKNSVTELPEIDAIFLTHEHEDHFHLASLEKFPKKTPIHLSELSSSAAFKILKKMGFENIRPLVAGKDVLVGDLVFHPLSSNLGYSNVGDEWDALPFVVFHKDEGCFFSHVDTSLDKITLFKVKMTLETNGFHNVLALLNQTLKWISLEQLFLGNESEAGVKVFPGLTTILKEQKIEKQENASGFIERATNPKVEGLSVMVQEGEKYAVSDNDPSETEWKLIEDFLDEYARYTYGRLLFKRLYSMDSTDLHGKRRSMAFILKAKSGTKIYECELSSRKFSLVESLGAAVLFEFWAIDFLAALRGEIEVRVLTSGHFKCSVVAPIKKMETLYEFFSFFHPLSRPEITFNRYLNFKQ